MITKDDIWVFRNKERTTNLTGKDLVYVQTSKVADELQRLRGLSPGCNDYMILYRDLLKELIYLERTLRAKEEKK